MPIDPTKTVIPDPPLGPTELDERRVWLLVEELFQRFADKSQQDDDSNASDDSSDLRSGHILAGDLPAILVEFEAMRTERQEQGDDLKPLIQSSSSTQVQAFADQNSSVSMSAHQLVRLILVLQESSDNSLPDARPQTPASSVSSGVDESHIVQNAVRDVTSPIPLPSPGDSDSEHEVGSSKPPRHSRILSSSPIPPGSEASEDEEIGMDYSASQSVMHARNPLRTTSTPARRASTRDSSSPHRRRPSALDLSSRSHASSPMPESVLRDHGKAGHPPTSWHRPKSGLRGRSSEVMSPSSEAGETDITGSRIRRTSYLGSSEHGDISLNPEDGGGAMLSAHGYADTSFGASNSNYADMIRTNERLVHAQRALERTMETKDDEHEEQVADLHSRLESTENNLASKKREEREALLKASHAADQVASLEAEMATLTKRNVNLEETYKKGREQLEDLMAETEQLRRQRDELRERAATLKESEEYERDQAEVANNEVARLKHLIEEKEQRIDQLLGLQSENEKLTQETLALRTTVSKLKDEMEERARAMSTQGSVGRAKGAPGRPMLDGTPSRRLGAELARELASNESNDDTDSESGLPHSGEADNSFVETVTRRYKRKEQKIQGIKYAEQGTQTEELKSAELAIDSTEAPPTYDEAALEKTIVNRLHPHPTWAEWSDLHSPDLRAWPEYIELSKQLGIRCTLLEARMQAAAPCAPLGTMRSSTNIKASVARVLNSLSDLVQGRASNDSTKIGTVYVHLGWAVMASIFLLGMLVAHLFFAKGTIQIGPFQSSTNEFANAHAFLAPAGTTHLASYELPLRWAGIRRTLREHRGLQVPF